MARDSSEVSARSPDREAKAARASVPRVLERDNVVVAQPTGDAPAIRCEVLSMPRRYIDWIDQGRRKMYKSILGERKAQIRFFSQHLPVVVTHNDEKPFPFNCANKGVGFVPKREYLTEFIELFEEAHRRTQNRPWRESLEERVHTMSRFYFDRQKIDYRALASLEIFERNTFSNLCRRPVASLLYTGDCPDYTSFQLDCVVEIVGPDDPRHRFATLARTMFEFDRFHIAQSRFPYAYIFWISGVTDKTPVRVMSGLKDIRSPVVGGGMRWLDEATQAVSRAPGMIQEYIRESVEEYAIERGFTEITLAVVQEAKDNLT